MDVVVEVVVGVGEVLASFVPSSVVPPQATPATTSVAPPKTMAARVAREMGWGTPVLWALLQKGQVVSVARTWRAHEAQSFKDMALSVHSNGRLVQSKIDIWRLLPRVTYAARRHDALPDVSPVLLPTLARTARSHGMSTSLAARALVWALRAQRRQRKYATAEGLHARIRNERATETYEPPRALFDSHRVIRRTHHGMPVFSLVPKERGPAESGLRFVYLHGGAYVSEVAPQHWALVAELSRSLGCEAIVPIYPLAPEHHAAEVVEAVVSLVESLQDARVGGPGRLVLVGDSAGGGLALAVTQALVAKGRTAIVNGLVLLSPWLDGTLAHHDVARIAPSDPWLAPPGLVEAAKLYAGEEGPESARVSPLFASFEGLPRTLILAGTRDVLFPDAERYFARSLAEGVDTTFLRYEDMVHVWMLVDALPEAQEARRRVVEWLRA